MALKRLRPVSASEEHSVCPAVVRLSSPIRQTHVPSDYTVELFETHCFFDSPHCFFLQPLTVRRFLSILTSFPCRARNRPSDAFPICPCPALAELFAAKNLPTHPCCASVGLFYFFIPEFALPNAAALVEPLAVVAWLQLPSSCTCGSSSSFFSNVITPGCRP